MDVLLVVAILFTSVAALTDLRGRIIPNWLTYPMISTGIIYHAAAGAASGDMLEMLSGAAGALTAFILGFALYLVGGWAGGDVKLFTGIGAILPVVRGAPYPFFISVLFNSVIVTLLLLPTMFLLRRGREGGVLYQTVAVRDLKEGIIPADLITVDGRVYANPRRAAGLTKEEIRELKRLAAEGRIPDRLRVKIGIPFAPVMLAGLVLAAVFGDLYLALISRFL
jgi:Flp pilus assembly protein protease CpaA